MVAPAHIKDMLGVGMYTPQEAACYARIPVGTLTRWLYGSRQGQAVLRPQVSPPGEKVVTFLDFVQALAIREIRSQHRIPLETIRAGLERATERHGVAYPFARRHATYLYHKDILIVLPGSRDDLVQLTGKHIDQLAMKRILEVYLEDLTFDPDEGLATSYKAFEWQEHRIVMDPQRRFGEPIVASCGYTARALWEACRTEGGLELVAETFGVTAAEVEAAYRYYLWLDCRNAA